MLPLPTDLQPVHDHVAATAAEVDAGVRDVRDGLRWLGARGLLRPHPDRGERVGDAVRLIRALASASLADAFAVWSQTMVIEYLRCCPPAQELAVVLEELTAGTVPGATALAPALADLSGGPAVPVLATPVPDGWALTGPVPWASNLFDGAAVVLPARTPDGGRLVALLRLGDPGVAVRPPTPLLALNATGTSRVDLAGAAVPAGAVLSRDLGSFLGLCRPTMLLTQAALAVGVADAALASAAEALSAPVAAEHAALVTRRDDVAAELAELAAGRGAPGGVPDARLAGLELVARAVELEGLVRGGSGYAAASPTSRRRREAAFLPLQAPTALQLRAAA